MTREQRSRSTALMEMSDALEEFIDEPLRLSGQQTEALLHDLCVELGYCLGPKETDAIVANPPTNPRAFAELVMTLDGVESDDPAMCTPVLVRVLKMFIGASSGTTRGESSSD
jgi:hypothetical protein